MTKERLSVLLTKVSRGKLSIEKAIRELADMPFEDIGIASLDHHRALRLSQPEVVYGKSKSVSEICAIARAIVRKKNNLLITRIDAAKAKRVLSIDKKLRYNERAECIVGEFAPVKKHGLVAVVSAGTSDMHVVEEAYETLSMLGNNAVKVIDVGVAGIHRLFHRLPEIRKANVVIAVAGMEGALASVIGGLVAAPVIAVPTSVGYGANFGGVSALLSMLNSCSPNVVTVNIDNGFAAAYAASLMNRRMTSN
ncbi:MAG: nickel pincer cofactor biosynthesis protein LarB [Spirochaetota bacterium]